MKATYALSSVICSSLLLIGCVSSTSTTTTTATKTYHPETTIKTTTEYLHYRLPEEIYDGYWAMNMERDSHDYFVVNFTRDGYSNHYTFRCHPNGSYQQLHTEKSKLEPTANSVRIINSPTPFSLEVISLQPKQTLTLKQRFDRAELKSEYPNGINFSYIYTPKLKPLCPKIR